MTQGAFLRRIYRLPIGRVIRAIGGFFYIEPCDDSAGALSQSHKNTARKGEPLECSIRGKLKLDSEGIFVGDKVEFSVAADGAGVITGIMPRETVLKRPYIANVNLIVLVFAHRNPEPNDYLMAKFLVLAETSGVPYMIVLNKTDLASKSESRKLVDTYRNYGYQVLCTSVVTHVGKRILQKALANKVAVLAGPSGVGKSALVNMVAPGYQLQTGLLSEKIGRGKHTTREVQLLQIKPESFIADTPGFSQISLDFLKPPELAGSFPDFEAYLNLCKFKTCLHQSEPGCAVKTAVSDGEISPKRYQCYLDLLTEIREAWENRYR
jgi:ribosome biogenesis GTPase